MAPSLMDTTFIMSTETTTTTTSQILSASQEPRTSWSIVKKRAQEVERQSSLSTWPEYETSQSLGTLPQKEESGIESTQSSRSQKNFQSSHVLSAEQCIGHESIGRECAAKSAREQGETICRESRLENAPERVPVYDLEIDGEHEFFAWGALVHNCDALSLVAFLHQTAYGSVEDEEIEENEAYSDICGF